MDKPIDAEDRARRAAEDWLALTGRGEIEESWARTSEVFREVVTPAQWARTVDRTEDAHGRPVRREFSSAEYMRGFAGSPGGHYVVVTFDTTFENTRDGRELVVPQLDSDGTWRVAGYFVR